METVQIGRVSVLVGARGGKYPSGNSVFLDDDVRVMIDPSLDVAAAGADVVGGPVDVLINTHAHEDHFAGNPRFPEARLMQHEADAPAMRSLKALVASYGMSAESEAAWTAPLVDTFNFEPRSDIETFRDGDVLETGKGRIRFLHMPGHTPGHTCLLIEPENLLVLGDWDMTWFGPYYGDAGASLDETIASLARVRELAGSLDSMVSFHEAGVITDDLVGTVDRYTAVVDERSDSLLQFVKDQPRTLDEIADQCFVYRKRYEKLFWQPEVERRMMEMHARRLADESLVAIEGETVSFR